MSAPKPLSKADVSKASIDKDETVGAADGDFSFEAALERLEALVHSMEEGELSLEQSLQAFESGIRLTRQCQQALQEAEQKVQVLMDAAGTPQPFSEVGEID